MKKLPVIGSEKMISFLEKKGYVFDRQNGSHCILIMEGDNFHEIVVPKHKELSIGVRKNILRISNSKRDELIAFCQD